MKNSLLAILTLIMGAVIATGCDNQEAATMPEQSTFNPENSVVLVTGITGNQGGGVAATLLEQGFQVRGLTRDPSSEDAKYWSDLGAEMVQGDFTDYPSIDAALVGADYVFINIQEQVPDYVAATKYLLDAAHKAGVKHIVYSSNRRSDPELSAPASKTEIELYLRASGYSFTTMRLPQMMSNFIRDRDMQNVLRNGVVARGAESAPYAYFSPDDMGIIAAASFADPTTWNGREINLAGDELTDKELATLLSEVSGLEIAYTPPPAEVDARWAANQNLSYDTEQLRQEFPGIMTLREYLVSNNYGEKLREMSTQPLPPEPVDNRPAPGSPAPR